MDHFSFMMLQSLEREHRRNLQSEAEWYRMVSEAEQTREKTPGLMQRMIFRLGTLLVQWGYRMQAREAGLTLRVVDGPRTGNSPCYD